MKSITLILILGPVGSGKTLFATILSRWFFAHGREVVSNYTLAGARAIDIHAFLKDEYSNCGIILDEAYVYLESRTSGRALNRVLSYLLFQSRKTGLDLILTAQLSSTLDVRWRRMADIVIECNCWAGCFQYEITLLARGNTTGSRSLVLPLEKARYFFGLYDTMEKVTGISRMDEVMRTVMSGEEKRGEAVKHLELARKMFGRIKLTKARVDYYCEIEGVPRYLANAIYLEAQMEEKEAKGEE